MLMWVLTVERGRHDHVIQSRASHWLECLTGCSMIGWKVWVLEAASVTLHRHYMREGCVTL